MRLSPVVIALIAVVVAQALARPQSESSETPELTFEKPHLITIVYCTSCGCYERNSKRIAEEIMDHFPDKHFEAVLTPRQGYFDIYITKAGTSQKVIVWSYATKMVGTDKFPATSSLIPIIRNVIDGKI